MARVEMLTHTLRSSHFKRSSGGRADCPIELVFETSEVMKHAWLMESASEGVLTREPVPGSCVLYIRDTLSGQTLYARPVEPEQQQEDIVEEETSRPRGQASAPPEAPIFLKLNFA